MEIEFERPGHKSLIKYFDAVPTTGDTVLLKDHIYDIDDVTWDLNRDVVVVDLSP